MELRKKTAGLHNILSSTLLYRKHMEERPKERLVFAIEEWIDDLREDADKRRRLINMLFSEFPDEFQRSMHLRVGAELKIDGDDVSPDNEACPCTMDSSPRLFRRPKP